MAKNMRFQVTTMAIGIIDTPTFFKDSENPQTGNPRTSDMLVDIWRYSKLKSTEKYIFLISQRKHILWVLIRSTSVSTSNEYYNICFLGEIMKIFTWHPVLSRANEPDQYETMHFFFNQKNTDIFLISQQKHMLWVLIRSASVRRF